MQFHFKECLYPSCIQSDEDDAPIIMDETERTARHLKLEDNEEYIEELLMEQENGLVTEEPQELLNDGHHETRMCLFQKR
ncbi:hypothetical protein AVEN_30061-1 [Araneus ventricosus]|uniref:Uncharacterized protein n=1 Tax=Araneus ventricosus TaxID=182803 RepID=A0A4Y2I7D6_ARAVE|nr:hypothetical protein AVEN_30061-1 [Araneus ventricosus]